MPARMKTGAGVWVPDSSRNRRYIGLLPYRPQRTPKMTEAVPVGTTSASLWQSSQQPQEVGYGTAKAALLTTKTNCIGSASASTTVAIDALCCFRPSGPSKLLSMSEVLDAVLKTLLRARQDLVDKLTKSPLGQELVRLDRAIADLAPEAEQHQVSDQGVRFPIEPGWMAASGLTPSGPAVRLFDQPRMSVKTKALTLLEEEDRKWTYDEILKEWERRGDPIQGNKPKQALRTATWDLVSARRVVALEPGVFKAAKFVGRGP